MKKYLLLIMVILSCVFMACKGNSENPENGEEETPPAISSGFWGTWIQMDNGKKFYIDGEAVYSSTSSDKKGSKVQDGISGYTLENEIIMKKGSTVFFKKGGAARDFTATIAGFSDDLAASYARAVNTGKQGVSGRRKNKNNKSDTQEVVSDSEGKVKFTDAVADDIQVIEVSNGTNIANVNVCPLYDGENVGSIPIYKKGSYCLKTSYEITNYDNNEQIMYGNHYREYKMTFKVSNIGAVDCEAGKVTLSWDDPKLRITSPTGNYNTIEPNHYHYWDKTIVYEELTEEFVDVPVKVTIEDSSNNVIRTWEDSINLRFYREPVTLKVNAKTTAGNTSSNLNGFFIYPDGRSQRFTVRTGNTENVLVPWSKKDYTLVFSGASATEEMKYSFGVSDVASLTGTWEPSELIAFEPNDTFATASVISDISTPTKAYIKKNDIDFYKVNFSEVESNGYNPLVFDVTFFNDKVVKSNNILELGETLRFGGKYKNVSTGSFSNIKMTVSSSSPYVEILNSTYTRTNSLSSNSEDNITGSYAFRFKITDESLLEEGAIIPLTMTFTVDGAFKNITWTKDISLENKFF